MLNMLLAKMSEEEKTQFENERRQRQNDPMRISFNILNQYARHQADQYAQAHLAEQLSAESTTHKERTVLKA